MKIGIVGAALILISAAIFGFREAASLKLREKTLFALLELIKLIRARVDCFREPLSEIYAEFESRHLRARGFIEELRENGASSALGVLTELDDEETEILKLFFGKLGGDYHGDTVRLCLETEERLTALGERLRLDYPARARVYRTLPILGGISVILLLM